MKNILNFNIKKLVNGNGEIFGYQVVCSDKSPMDNSMIPFMQLITDGMGVNLGEQWKQKSKPEPEKEMYFQTDKELMDFFIFTLGEFKDKK